jgi:hypothetical protein
VRVGAYVRVRLELELELGRLLVVVGLRDLLRGDGVIELVIKSTTFVSQAQARLQSLTIWFDQVR